MTNLDHPQRFITLRGCVNFRDLGGYLGEGGRPIRWGLVFRSGSTHQLDEADRTRLAGLGIRTVIDLRSSRERDEYPHALAGLPDVAYWAAEHDHASGNLSRMLKDSTVDEQRMGLVLCQVYRTLPYEFSDAYRHFLSSLAFAPLPLAFNCAAGKDRTGVAAALLLSALGVAWDDIVADYLLSERAKDEVMRLYGWTEAKVAAEGYNPRAVGTLLGVDARYLQAMHEEVIRRSGSIEGYLLSELGLDASVIEAVRARLLVCDPPP